MANKPGFMAEICQNTAKSRLKCGQPPTPTALYPAKACERPANAAPQHRKKSSLRNTSTFF
jgi:hypothetical protein